MTTELRRGSLTFAQRGIVRLSDATRGAPWQNVFYWVDIKGYLDIEAFRKALAIIQERHEPLRTRYCDSGVGVEAVVIENAPLPFKWLRIDPNADILPIADASSKICFDRRSLPLWDVKLISRSDTLHDLILCFDHLCADLWAMTILAKELSQIYNALISNVEHNLRTMRLQCVDGARLEKDWVNSLAGEKSLNWWCQHLGFDPAKRNLLPGDRPRYNQPYLRAAQLTLRLRVDLATKLRKLARQRRQSLYSVLLAGLHGVLHQHGCGPAPIVGTRMAARLINTASMLGVFRNTVVLRPWAIDNPSLEQLLERASKTTLEAIHHQHTPYDLLKKSLSERHDVLLDDLVLVMLIFDESPFSRLEIVGTETNCNNYVGLLRMPSEFRHDSSEDISDIRRFVARSHADLTVYVVGNDASLLVNLIYKMDRIGDAIMRKFAKDLLGFLSALGEL